MYLKCRHEADPNLKVEIKKAEQTELGIIYLTPHGTKSRNEAVSVLTAPEAGAPEVEVTPAMIEAGLEEYNSVWTDLRDARPNADVLMLTRAFRAMALSRRQIRS